MPNVLSQILKALTFRFTGDHGNSFMHLKEASVIANMMICYCKEPDTLTHDEWILFLECFWSLWEYDIFTRRMVQHEPLRSAVLCAMKVACDMTVIEQYEIATTTHRHLAFIAMILARICQSFSNMTDDERSSYDMSLKRLACDYVHRSDWGNILHVLCDEIDIPRYMCQEIVVLPDNEILSDLLKAGADPFKRNQNGETPLDVLMKECIHLASSEGTNSVNYELRDNLYMCSEMLMDHMGMTSYNGRSLQEQWLDIWHPTADERTDENVNE